MKTKMKNLTRVEGYLYEHDLQAKVTGESSKAPGTQFITGTVSIATDEELTNIVPVHFTYVTSTFGSTTKENPNFGILTKIITGDLKTVMSVGKDAAAKLSISSAIGLNEFFSDRSGTKELVSVQRNEGGFINVVNKLNPDEKRRNTFEQDMVITNVRLIEADPEKGTQDKAIVKGCVFDFRKAILPVEFSVTNKFGIDYFLGLEASDKNPIFTKVRGIQVSETVVRKIEEESAFGETYVREIPSSRKDWVITWTPKEPGLWDDESTITAAELKNAIADRQVLIAAIQKRQEEYEASKSAIPSAPSNQVAAGGFNF